MDLVEGTNPTGHDFAVEFGLNTRLANHRGRHVVAVVNAGGTSVAEAAITPATTELVARVAGDHHRPVLAVGPGTAGETNQQLPLVLGTGRYQHPVPADPEPGFPSWAKPVRPARA
ncbi:hypothetical protein [Paeniglutamicibacter cryotolerans]|uniref:Uncharacterized protein n=1 Tax=Paeniglutamicibacter cryotolerans TaxID=670079 RepID=A0A839QPB8_9MICC|nr:hypothetical protein [Paeniglutamicibacter cryotolerans]MBB2995072.1 hypothetical protein [Paeniglutamicibacter cryotolerans]